MHYYRIVDSDGNVSYEERPIASEIDGAEEIDEETYAAELEAFIAAMQPAPTDEATEADLMDALTELGVNLND